MAKIDRCQSPRHKVVKRFIAAGKYKMAESELESERDSLLHMLKYTDCDREKIELRLTRNSSLFAECYSRWGKPLKAEKWFTKALKHCDHLKDPIVRERILRVRAVHRATIGRHEDVEPELEGVIGSFERLKYEVLTPERMELEIIFTRGRLTECILMRDPLNQSAAEELLEVQKLLVGCGKPFYEIEILMACINLKVWVNPLRMREIYLRAFALNSLHARNGDYFVRISNATTIVPIASYVRDAAARLGL